MCRPAFTLGILLGIVASTTLVRAFTPPGPGLYAVFDTSAGEFTAMLEYEEVPLTVANFVGLAEGTRSTVNLSTGEVKTAPFYDGISFHRVAAGFVIQGGSPSGDGTDGPGFIVPDEISHTLSHDAAGVLSMANAGPNTNGSQFFITLAAATGLDGRHPVFGRIVDGLSVVQAIGSSPVLAGTETPVNPVVINSISIVREGAAAQAWDESAVVLPRVAYAPLAINPSTGNGVGFELGFTQNPFARYFLSISEDLENWSIWGTRSEAPSGPIESTFNYSQVPTTGGDFFRTVEDQKMIPEDMSGYRLQLLPADLPGITVEFGDDFGGTYTHTPSNGSPFTGTISYDWFEHANYSQLRILFFGSLVRYRNETTGAIVYCPNQPQQISLSFVTDGSGSMLVHYYRPSGGTFDWSEYPDFVREGTFFLTAPGS